MRCELVCTMYETNNLILPLCRCFSTIFGHAWCTLNGFATRKLQKRYFWRVSLQNLQVFQSFDLSGNELLQMAESDKEKADSEKVDSEASTAFNHSYAEYINPKQPLRAGNNWKLAYHGTWFYSLWSILYHGLLLESSNTSAGHSTNPKSKEK